MEDKDLPSDQSSVLFTDKTGISREGKYVSEMKAFVEISPTDSNLEEIDKDCSDVYPEDDIVQWSYLEGKSSDDGVIAVL